MNALVKFWLLVTLLCMGISTSYAAESAATPELDAKIERIKSQQAQRVTKEQREAAAAAQKAERLKIQKARDAQQAQPQPTTDEKSAQ
jgi:hypothetical protein